MESSFAPKDYRFRMLTKNSPGTSSAKRGEHFYKFFGQMPQFEWFGRNQ